jgi:hypothetical protein
VFTDTAYGSSATYLGIDVVVGIEVQFSLGSCDDQGNIETTLNYRI